MKCSPRRRAIEIKRRNGHTLTIIKLRKDNSKLSLKPIRIFLRREKKLRSLVSKNADQDPALGMK